MDFLTQVLQSSILPVSTPISGLAEHTSDLWAGITAGPRLRDDNERLKWLAQATEMYGQNEERLSNEIDRLRKLMALPRYGGRWRIPGEAIHYAPYEHRLTVSIGRRHGVRVGLPVVAAEGLLGVVQVVSENRSQVLLLHSRQLQVGAMVMRDPPQAGILRGEGPDLVELGMLDTQTPIEVGDVVVTSGYSELIPRGIPIGKIVQIENNPDFGARKAKVLPFVRVGKVRTIMVLR